jgi:hypothetical protein
MQRITIRLCRLLSVAALMLSTTGVHGATLRKVALSGDPAAGGPDGVTYNSFGAHFIIESVDIGYRGPVINDAGRVAFRANLSGSGVDSTNHQGIWSEGSGSLALVARAGDAAPGAPDGINFARNQALELFEPVLNNAGQTAFYGGLSDGTVGLWSEGSGSLALVAHDGMQVAGAPEGVTHNFETLRDFFPALPSLNDAGQLAFHANLAGSGVNNTNDWGVWSQGSDGLSMVARSGSPAPGTPEGVNFDSFFFHTGFNDSGQTAFLAYLTGSGVEPSNDQGIWSEASGSLTLVARNGSPAPGTASGVNFREFFYPVTLNNAGQTVFSGWLIGEGVDETNDEGVWSDESGTVTLVARSGDAAPGTPEGVNFAPFSLAPNAFLGLNDTGQVAFRGNLTGTGVNSNNDRGIWLEGEEGLELIARTGNAAPGTAGGVRFSGLSRPTLNNAGQVAFRGDLTGTGVGTGNNLGIWATNESGELQLIARKGTLLEVAPGDSRTISDLGFVTDSGNSDGRASAFNNLGQLVFWARFTNGTQGVFVSSLVAHLPGDFNNDGTVDAADYVVWRKTDGTQDGYDKWRGNFGRMLFTGMGSSATGFASALPESLSITVPEPAGILLAAFGMGVLTVRRRPTRWRAQRCERPTFAVAIAIGGLLSQVAAGDAYGATFNFNATANSSAVLSAEPNGGSDMRGLYVTGRIPTNVKGPIVGGKNINTLVGADAFYDQGYTGTNAVIANIEGGHIWSGHETLTHVQQIPQHPSVLGEFDRHATWVASVLGGRRGGANPGAYQEGLAPGAQLYSGAFCVQWRGERFSLGYSDSSEAVILDPYRKAYSTGVNPSGRTADVINSSWGGFVGSNGAENRTIGLDGFANANPRTLSVVAAGNDGPGPDKVRSPGSAYNNLSVGALGPNAPYNRPASFTSGGPNDYYDPVNGTKNDARQVVDIAAPGENLSSAYYGGETGGNGTTDNPSASGPGPTGLPYGSLGGPDYYTRGQLGGTSLASPTVAGGAALLYDVAYSALSNNEDARDARVMKAVLMNSADKTYGWNNGQVAHPNGNGGVLTTQGLDNRVGTGRMNLANAFNQYLNGTTDVLDAASGNLGFVNDVGWDFGQVVSGTTNDYFFDSQVDGGSTLTATLTWFRDRRIFDSNAVFDDSFDDLNLELWSVVDGAFTSLIGESSSLYNESEHFSFTLPETGDYALRVRWFKEVFDRVNDADQEFYGLAWSTAAAAALGAVAIPEPGSLLLLVVAAMPIGMTRRRSIGKRDGSREASVPAN